MSNVKTEDLMGLFLNLVEDYNNKMRDCTPELYVFYKGKFDAILELCMFLDFNELLLKLEELKK